VDPQVGWITENWSPRVTAERASKKAHRKQQVTSMRRETIRGWGSYIHLNGFYHHLNQSVFPGPVSSWPLHYKKKRKRRPGLKPKDVDQKSPSQTLVVWNRSQTKSRRFKRRLGTKVGREKQIREKSSGIKLNRDSTWKPHFTLETVQQFWESALKGKHPQVKSSQTTYKTIKDPIHF
jgi:hypothetical protein